VDSTDFMSVRVIRCRSWFSAGPSGLHHFAASRYRPAISLSRAGGCMNVDGV
jgi:hypothetical protein